MARTRAIVCLEELDNATLIAAARRYPAPRIVLQYHGQDQDAIYVDHSVDGETELMVEAVAPDCDGVQPPSMLGRELAIEFLSEVQPPRRRIILVNFNVFADTDKKGA
jgi:hypothetical protein